MADAGDLPGHCLRVVWRGQHLRVPLEPTSTVEELKEALMHLTGVQPEHQKILGLAKRGLPLDHDRIFGDDGRSSPRALTLLGSPDDEHHAQRKREEHMLKSTEEEPVSPGEGTHPPQPPAAHESSIEARVQSYKPTIVEGPRGGKRLLVLDMDYTLFDHQSVAEVASDLARPHLHAFLSAAYRNFDLVIWSATSLKWIQLKLMGLGMLNHPEFKIAMIYCEKAMVTTTSAKYGGVLNVKPLAVIWKQFPDLFSPANTIMVDDLGRNFLLNPKAGLKIPPCRNMTVPERRAADTELIKLGRYLDLLVELPSLAGLDHSDWHGAVRKKKIGFSSRRL